MRICIITDNAFSYTSRRFLKEGKISGDKVVFSPWKSLVFEKETISLLKI